ncbi:MW1434 family type I TA system toxin [Enterococcus faecalis]|uniref:Thoeris anti-defense Tad2 family protein n=1 Tax=Enterococcus faecalis TaxID=1351 RepID=UPI00032EF081|nr:MW1434 family type I TA system toxin [Enterococcus faecalis]EOJ20303.1 hypothetical protein UMS_00444 [Enterococcus faecalis EnGen0287]MCU2257770.1 DUF2829 domain-containing protein [Enterococcus faecalis]HAP3748825.1 DUF2829 domain-containing protein [Enterococcus faecalis]HCT6554221.1 DUF2829 domain-containing protein [Enterococcus faecalis]HCT6555675.1 DUF2829 domain-containing protein [Enterococcus faecalis]
MNIQEAVEVAISKGKYIYRQSEREEGIEVNIFPTNTWDCCILISKGTEKVGKRWNPSANDLMANDWQIS